MKNRIITIGSITLMTILVFAFAACKSEVDPVVTGITVKPAVVNAVKGKLKQKQLSAVVAGSGSGYTAVTWAVVDSGTTGEGTISVDSNGKLTVNTSALAGTAIIRATSNVTGELYSEAAVNVLVQGDGTASTPYLVDDGPSLASIGGAWPLDAYYKQIDDIDLASYANWTPIGNDANKFTGSYDGSYNDVDFTISNLTIDRSATDSQGLFGVISGADAVLKNIKLTNVNIIGKGNVGGVIGMNDSGTVENCFGTGLVTGDASIGGIVGYSVSGYVIGCFFDGSVSGVLNIGGVVGFSTGIVIGCYASSNVNGTDNAIGGVVGNNFLGEVTDCYSSSNVTGTGNVIGGVVGINNGSTAKVVNCFSIGDVTGIADVGGVTGSSTGILQDCYTIGNITGNLCVGGVVGSNNGSASKVFRCYTTGVVSGETDIGGIAGVNFNLLIDCYATGTVSGTGIDSHNIGGVIGDNQGTLQNCYALGAVSGNHYLGGMAGSNTGEVTSCVALNASVNGSSFAGRLIGYNTGAGDYPSSYGRTGMPITGGSANAAIIPGLDVAPGAYNSQAFWAGIGWDFTIVWEMSGDNLPVFQ